MKAYHDKNIMKREFMQNPPIILYNSKLKLFLEKLKSKWSKPLVVKSMKPFGAIEIENPKTKQS